MINQGCTIQLWHGPGHQSAATCDVQGPHTVHHVVYGESLQNAKWIGGDALTGVFDEPEGIHLVEEGSPADFATTAALADLDRRVANLERAAERDTEIRMRDDL